VAEVSPVKTSLEFRTIKAYFQVAVKWDLLAKNPCAGVKSIKISPQRPAFLSKDEFSILMTSIKREWLKDVVRFAVATMMRAGEIVNLQWDSVDLENRVILVENKDGFRVKTRQPRSIPMNDWVYEFLSARRKPSGYVFRFNNGSKMSVGRVSWCFKLSIREAGLSEKLHFHSLRHTGASWLVRHGVSIFAVQRLLGHSNISVTMGYSHLASGDLHDVVNRIRVEGNAVAH